MSYKILKMPCRISGRVGLWDGGLISLGMVLNLYIHLPCEV